MPQDLIFCVNCESSALLNVHGYCERCGSDAVVRRTLTHMSLVARLYPEQDPQVVELERLFKQ